MDTYLWPSGDGMRRIYKHQFGKNLLGEIAESVHYYRRLTTLGIAEVIESYHWASAGVDAGIIALGKRPADFWRRLKKLDTKTGLRRKLVNEQHLLDCIAVHEEVERRRKLLNEYVDLPVMRNDSHVKQYLLDDVTRWWIIATSIRDDASDAERTRVRRRCIRDAVHIAVALRDKAQRSCDSAEARVAALGNVADDDPNLSRALKSRNNARVKLARLQDVVETCSMTAQALNDSN